MNKFTDYPHDLKLCCFFFTIITFDLCRKIAKKVECYFEF